MGLHVAKSWHFMTSSHRCSSSTCCLPGVRQAPSVCWTFSNLTLGQVVFPATQSLGSQRLRGSHAVGVTLGLGWRILGPSESDLGALALPRWVKPAEGWWVPEVGLRLGTRESSSETRVNVSGQRRPCPRGDPDGSECV